MYIEDRNCLFIFVPYVLLPARKRRAQVTPTLGDNVDVANKVHPSSPDRHFSERDRDTMFALTQAASLAPVRAKASIRRRTQTARTKAVNIRASSTDEEAADSASYRTGDGEAPSGILGKLVSNLPDGRKSSAPESYGSRPESITLQEGRYRRPPPERVGGVTEDAVRGEDYEVVDGPSFGIGTLVGVLLAIATLGGAYLTVNKLSQGPVAPREGAVRMPATDRS